MLLVAVTQSDHLCVLRSGRRCRSHLDKLKREAHRFAAGRTIFAVATNPIERLDEWPTDMRFIYDEHAVLRDERGVNRPRLFTHSIASKEQPGTRLIHRAANNHRLEQRPRPATVTINPTPKLNAPERARSS